MQQDYIHHLYDYFDETYKKIGYQTIVLNDIRHLDMYEQGLRRMLPQKQLDVIIDIPTAQHLQKLSSKLHTAFLACYSSVRHCEEPPDIMQSVINDTIKQNVLNDTIIFERIRRHYAVLIIQKHWKECISNPQYKVCHRRLLREHSDF